MREIKPCFDLISRGRRVFRELNMIPSQHSVENIGKLNGPTHVECTVSWQTGRRALQNPIFSSFNRILFSEVDVRGALLLYLTNRVRKGDSRSTKLRCQEGMPFHPVRQETWI